MRAKPVLTLSLLAAALALPGTSARAGSRQADGQFSARPAAFGADRAHVGARRKSSTRWRPGSPIPRFTGRTISLIPARLSRARVSRRARRRTASRTSGSPPRRPSASRSSTCWSRSTGPPVASCATTRSCSILRVRRWRHRRSSPSRRCAQAHRAAPRARATTAAAAPAAAAPRRSGRHATPSSAATRCRRSPTRYKPSTVDASTRCWSRCSAATRTRSTART